MSIKNIYLFYQTQGVSKPEEFDEFIATMKKDLPSTFRITGSKAAAKKMLGIVEDELIKECVQQSKETTPPNMFPLPWYNFLIYNLSYNLTSGNCLGIQIN